ncbi:hypothetical protein E5288_WYG015535 [Bos mutus]|uniref:Bcl-2 Bcl-2 homology region 1-3 domain-containing protein n=1 Tax=Bos mutus TaxID=72004 RepID=A0A6B0RNE3_9CETA|nr:hypothetical protein [Bos mutus]
MTTVKQALREASNEFKLRYQQTFSDLMSQLRITPGTACQSFEQVINELFWDRVKWGHVVAFFSFSGTLCMKSIDKEIHVLVSQVTTSMATYLNNHVKPWIQENGGWDTFVELYESNTTNESQKGQERFNCWSLTTRLWLEKGTDTLTTAILRYYCKGEEKKTTTYSLIKDLFGRNEKFLLTFAILKLFSQIWLSFL